MQNIWNHNLSWATIYNNVTIYSGSSSLFLLVSFIYVYIFTYTLHVCLYVLYVFIICFLVKFLKFAVSSSGWYICIYIWFFSVHFCLCFDLFLYFMLIFYDHAAAQEKRKVSTIPWRAKNEDILEVCIVCSIFHIKNFAPSRSFNNLRHFSEKRMQELISKRNI